MSREIKFRAWNPKAQQLRARGDSNPYTISVGFIYDSNPGKSLFFELAHKGEMLVQQYTGLKDRSGAEIYEGDIILVIDTVSREQSVHEVKWVGIGWTRQILFTQVEVIGNIYEHGHLLEANQ